MRCKWLTALLILALSLMHPISSLGARPGRQFFGVAPQTTLNNRDAAYMAAARIGIVRWPFDWSSIEPEEGHGFHWGPTDRLVEVAAKHGLTIWPFLDAGPEWAAPSYRTLPVHSTFQLESWRSFVVAVVRRYGPQGRFWKAHGPGSSDPLRSRPIRFWQIWNEANFSYFAQPVSPSDYGHLLKFTSKAIKNTAPGAKVILSGLFGRPRGPRADGIPAARFLADLYRVRGVKGAFDGIALHPYAAHVSDLRRLVRSVHAVAVRHGDGRKALVVTEMGWGSEADPKIDSFEQGTHGQVRELRRAYRFLIANRRHFHLHRVFWFTWKDIQGSCDFCDSTGLFRAGPGLDPKPAWRALVKITGGRVRPLRK